MVLQCCDLLVLESKGGFPGGFLCGLDEYIKGRLFKTDPIKPQPGLGQDHGLQEEAVSI